MVVRRRATEGLKKRETVRRLDMNVDEMDGDGLSGGSGRGGGNVGYITHIHT